MTNVSQPTPTHAVRLLFEYEGDQVRLVTQQRVNMAVTGFDISRTTPLSGYYVEARSAANETLSRVSIRGAFATSAEVFPEHPNEPITRIDRAKPQGAFTVVVPAPETADHVAVVQVTPSQPEPSVISTGVTGPVPGGPKRIEIARFQLETSN